MQQEQDGILLQVLEGLDDGLVGRHVVRVQPRTRHDLGFHEAPCCAEVAARPALAFQGWVNVQAVTCGVGPRQPLRGPKAASPPRG